MIRIIWGIVFIGIGALFFGRNLNRLDFDIGELLLRFWPVIFIIIGLTILADITKSVILRFFVIVIIIAIFALPFIFDFLTIPTKVVKSSEATILLKDAKTLDISIDAGAIDFLIDNDISAKNAVEASLSSKYLTLKSSEKQNADSLRVDLTFKKAVSNIFQFNNIVNKFKIHINDFLTIKTLEINVGASTINADLTPFKIENIDLDTGATTLNLKFGTKSNQQNVKIDSGASTLNIKVPTETGIQLQYDGGLTSKNLPDDFISVSRGLYQSENYGSAAKKIIFDVNLGAATLNIERY